MNQDISQLGGEYLTLVLGTEQYGIDILKVQEIRGYDTVSVVAIAQTPRHIRGVINLRGVIVPIIDLRIKFKLPVDQQSTQAVVIILGLGSKLVGIVVDSVSDVLLLEQEQIRARPELSCTVDIHYIKGLAVVDHTMVILLDIEKLMESSEMALFEEALV